MKKHSVLLLALVLLLGWVFDFLFWQKSLGVNFAIFLTLCLLAGFILLRTLGLKPAAKSLWLLLPFVFFIAITCVRREPVTQLSARFFSLFSLGLLAVSYASGRWVQYSLFDYGYKFYTLALGVFVRPFHFFRQSRQDFVLSGKKIETAPIKPVIRGVLIAIPIVIFFSMLLASADVVFSQKMGDLFDSFSLEKFPETIIRLIIILIVGYLLLGIFLHAAAQSEDDTLVGDRKPVIKRFLGFTEAAIVLGSVVALFLLFVIVQFRYFFGGEVNIGVEGYTYSEYARSGFSELIAVAFFSLVMVLGLSIITRRETSRQAKIYSGFSIALLALVIVILVSAYQRLALAIDWHGFSRLRLYPRIFLIWVGLLFVTVIVLEIFRWERFFALAALVACIGFTASLGVLNVDATIVRHNVNRAIAGKHFNVNHLTTLSPDAVPALYAEFMDPSLPVKIQEGVGAALMCFVNSDLFLDDPLPDWRSANFSDWRAFASLDNVDDLLQGYTVISSRDPFLVQTPNLERYNCSQTWR